MFITISLCLLSVLPSFQCINAQGQSSVPSWASMGKKKTMFTVEDQIRLDMLKTNRLKNMKYFQKQSNINEFCKTASNAQCKDAPVNGAPFHVNGIFPSLTATADSGPIRSESGTGALMPWADNLYMVSYLSVPGSGSGTGLYQITSSFEVSFCFIDFSALKLNFNYF